MAPRANAAAWMRSKRQRTAAAREKEAEKEALKRQKKVERAAKERLVTWSLRLPKSLDDALKAMAKAERRSANKQVEVLIQEAVDRWRARTVLGAGDMRPAAGTTETGS